jgi:hypothetical protein
MAQHHLVPVLCLKQFTDQKEHVWTYSKQDGRSWHRRPEDTAKVADFYSFEREDGSMDDTIESLLSEIEDKASRPYDKLVAGRLVFGPLKNNFANFLAAQVVRTSTQRRLSAKMYAWIMQIHLAARATIKPAFKSALKMLSDQGVDVSDKETIRKTFLDPSGYNIAVPKHTTLQSLAIADKSADLFYAMEWWRSPAGHKEWRLSA